MTEEVAAEESDHVVQDVESAEGEPESGTPTEPGGPADDAPPPLQEDASGAGPGEPTDGDDQVGGPDEPTSSAGFVIPDGATAQAAAIEADTASSITAVRAHVAQQHAELMAQENAVLGVVSGRFDAAIAWVGSTVAAGAAQVSRWLASGAQAVLAVVGGLASAFVTGAATVLGAVASAATTLVSAAVRGAGVVAEGIAELATSLPIPDLPGVGRVRRFVRATAASVAGVVRDTSRAVGRFVGEVVAETVGLVRRAAARAGAVVVRIGGVVLGLVRQATAAVRGALLSLGSSVTSSLRAGVQGSQAAVRRHFSAARSQVDQIARRTRAQLGENRDDALDGLASDPDPESIDVEEAIHRAENERLVAEAFGRIGRVVALTVSSATEYVALLAARLLETPRRVASAVSRVIVALVGAAAAVFGRAVSLVSGYAGRVVAALGAVGRVVLAIVTDPLTALGRAAALAGGGLRALLHRVVTPVRDVLRGVPSGLERSLTQGLREITVPRLRAAARMASPPAAAVVVLVPVAVGVELGVVLFWVGVVLLVILVIVALVLLIQELARARPRPVPVDRPSDRARHRRQRRRRQGKPFRWNLLPGWSFPFLDWNGKLVPGNPTHIERHHVWPEYVGGLPAQVLMPVRADLHQWVLHPELHGVIAAFASARGFAVASNAPAVLFVAHLRANADDRAAFALVLTAFYVAISAETDPGIPPPAYGVGIAESAAALSVP
ncbi:hypothetical protein [Xylanimonas cellulosilytica]|uniref:hypothetical protein n=1 Tax=Xylanimonas cellulosilytica TaxID=186189 RepID=UPI0011D043FF|nr:hypothetical protein [Xylanimonas cellulosilytica]